MTQFFTAAFLTAIHIRSSVEIKHGRATSSPGDLDFFISKTRVNKFLPCISQQAVLKIP